jgi:16S rRNA (guanine(527)-N(7))-methyltransferase RsmG
MWLSARSLSDLAAGAGHPLDPGAAGRLEAYLDLVVEHNRAINLVKFKSDEELAKAHGLDFLPLLAEVSEGEPVVDIGAGAGFLGLGLAIARPGLAVTLIEPNLKRAFFLQMVIAALGLSARVEEWSLEAVLPRLPQGPVLFVTRALPNKEKVLKGLGRKRTAPHRLGLLLGTDAKAFGAELNIWYSVQHMTPMPFRANSWLLVLQHVSRETMAPNVSRETI